MILTLLCAASGMRGIQWSLRLEGQRNWISGARLTDETCTQTDLLCIIHEVTRFSLLQAPACHNPGPISNLTHTSDVKAAVDVGRCATVPHRSTALVLHLVVPKLMQPAHACTALLQTLCAMYPVDACETCTSKGRQNFTACPDPLFVLSRLCQGKEVGPSLPFFN